MEVEILRLDNFGRGIAYYNDKICFIENSYPDEIVEFKIINEKKKYIEGKTIKIIKKSPYRIISKCPYSNICGGCNLQEYEYVKENEFKEEKIKQLVEKNLHINNIVKNIVYEQSNNYRNKIILHGNNNTLGLYCVIYCPTPFTLLRLLIALVILLLALGIYPLTILFSLSST